MDRLDMRDIGEVSARLAAMADDRTAERVSNQFAVIRGRKDTDEICNSYEEIINELVAQRAQAIAVAQAYESELQRYRISDEDIACLQGAFCRLLEIAGKQPGGESVRSLDQLRDLISVDTLKAMQLLGFDYKEAIGDPLTKACACAIGSWLGTGSGARGQQKGPSKTR